MQTLSIDPIVMVTSHENLSSWYKHSALVQKSLYSPSSPLFDVLSCCSCSYCPIKIGTCAWILSRHPDVPTITRAYFETSRATPLLLAAPTSCCNNVLEISTCQYSHNHELNSASLHFWGSKLWGHNLIHFQVHSCYFPSRRTIW